MVDVVHSQVHKHTGNKVQIQLNFKGSSIVKPPVPQPQLCVGPEPWCGVQQATFVEWKNYLRIKS